MSTNTQTVEIPTIFIPTPPPPLPRDYRKRAVEMVIWGRPRPGPVEFIGEPLPSAKIAATVTALGMR